jgi:aspartyl-tRNA(Asn)/glutamyl-tRNA(Gln) amidotransferase subunit C
MDRPDRTPKITRDEVLHVAKLARLQLAPDELARTEIQLGAILEYVAALSELDVTGVEPYFRVVAPTGQLRQDIVKPSLDHELVLSQAPASADGGFAVPKVMEDDG